MISRRGFITGLASALAAPAIIRTPGLLMPIRAMVPAAALSVTVVEKYIHEAHALGYSITVDSIIANLYSVHTDGTQSYLWKLVRDTEHAAS